jgi:hypothetical protein
MWLAVGAGDFPSCGGPGRVLITISGLEKQIDEIFIKLFFAGYF